MRLGLVFVSLLSVAAPVARADGLTAKEHYQRGTAAYALGRYADAAQEYEKAFDLKPDPALLYNAAQAHRLAGNKQRALLLYQNYLRIYGSQVRNTDEVKRHIANLKAAIASDEQSQSSPPVSPAPLQPSRDEPAAHATPEQTAPAITAPPPARPSRPLVKKAWFWGVVVGAAVVVAAGVTLGVVLGTSSTVDPSPSFGTLKVN
jgi:tetratricopeptide (TPR) repeat protein